MAEAEVELRQIGSHTPTRLLSTSSTHSLYLCKQRKKDVVIKLLHAPLATPEDKEAFLTRAKQLKKLKHRNIIEIQDYGLTRAPEQAEEQGYLVMQYVPGSTLRQRTEPGSQMLTDEVKRRLSPLADALKYAHVSNIFHGNLHPGNLLVAAHNDILLTDFCLPLPGISAAQAQEMVEQALPYMAPEQLRGTLSAASDQYALAVMVYEWLCGRRPHEAMDRAQLLQQQEHEPLPPPSSLNKNISPVLESVLLKALAYEPSERFQHVQAFADGYLRALMGLPVDLTTKPTMTRTDARARSVAPIPSIPAPVITNDEKATANASNGTSTDDFADIRAPLLASAPPAPAPASNGDKKTAASARTVFPLSVDAIDWDPRPAPVRNGASPLHDAVVSDLCQGGILSQSLPGYEERPAQIEMAAIVAQALTQNDHAIVEASTGTGKSIAYLLPIVRSGKVAIISTANKALQEQLFYKDIPFVQQHIKHFEAALVKGMGNYLCIDRMESERTGMQFYAKNRDFMRLVDITNDPDTHFTGDFETLDFRLPNDIRGKVCADSDQCAWGKCNYFGDCYVHKMRLKAERSQVIVVNHTLLLLDAAMDGFLLPERDVIVLDEAHHLEEEATRAFTITISPNSVTSLLAQHLLKNHSQLSLQDEANRQLGLTWQRLQQIAEPGYKDRANLQAPLEEGLKLATAIADLADSLRKQRPKDLPDKESQLYDKLLKRTQNLAEHMRIVFAADQPGKFVYYVERVGGLGARGGSQLQVSAAPLDITAWLKERLFDKCNVICTSATLATIGMNAARPEEKGPNFAYFRRRVGLDPSENPEVIERILPLTFDYESNALLYLPRHLPAPVYGPGSEDYTLAIAREMYSLVKKSEGRAFLLFSSKRMLDQAYELMLPHLDYPMLRQGDMSRIELTRRFREEKGAILFGLKSFWEGVDIAGEALSLVVIDKLPFDPPDDPVHEARVAQMKAAGENWFGIYVLPQAVLRLKQGLGRLLRTRDDRGVMAILDTRLHTKGYGKLVLNALPPARRTSSIKDVERFFNEEQDEAF
ncbi:MAG: helicase C-terminal domain-containing protein [Ktedonobacteraceae bacterium]